MKLVIYLTQAIILACEIVTELAKNGGGVLLP